MSCDLAGGITLTDCNQAVGGIKSVFVANAVDIMATATISNTLMTANTSTITFYEIEQHPEKAELSIRINASPENGTAFYDQELTVVVRDLVSADQKVVEDIIKASTLVVVKLHSVDASGNTQYMILGAENGCDVSGGNLETGRGFGDMQGITLNLRGRETQHIVVNMTTIPATWSGIS